MHFTQLHKVSEGKARDMIIYSFLEARDLQISLSDGVYIHRPHWNLYTNGLYGASPGGSPLSCCVSVTHDGSNKRTNFSSRQHFQIRYLERKVFISYQTPQNFIPWGRMDNTPTLVYVMTWCRICDRLLHWTVATECTGTYMCHQDSPS